MRQGEWLVRSNFQNVIGPGVGPLEHMADRPAVDSEASVDAEEATVGLSLLRQEVV
jgi:hypothetical protein